MGLIKLIEDSVEQFGKHGQHITLHPHLWHTAMQDQEFVDKIVMVAKEDKSPGQVARYKGVKIFISAGPTQGWVYEERILKALVALQAPHLLEFV